MRRVVGALVDAGVLLALALSLVYVLVSWIEQTWG